MYRCHNTKLVHVPLSRYQTCSRISNTIRDQLRNANINSYFQDTGLLVGMFEAFEPANQRNNSALKPPDFSVATFLIQRDYTTKLSLYYCSKNEIISRYEIYKRFSYPHLNAFKKNFNCSNRVSKFE